MPGAAHPRRRAGRRARPRALGGAREVALPIELALHVPRHAFSVRERARPGDLWRAFQEAAVLGSAAVGWPPHRYRAEGCAFIVRRMVAVHDSELRYGEALAATTWVRTFVRGLITHREIRLRAPDGRSVARASQEWVHVAFEAPEGQVALRPTRAADHLRAAFDLEDPDDPPTLPEPPAGAALADPPEHVANLPLRLVEMDPLAHLNHPAYIDLADEVTSAALAAAGVDPVRLLPIAESVTFRAGLAAPGAARITARVRAVDGAAVWIDHRFVAPDGKLAAEATTVRTLADLGPAPLAAALS